MAKAFTVCETSDASRAATAAIALHVLLLARSSLTVASMSCLRVCVVQGARISSLLSHMLKLRQIRGRIRSSLACAV